MFEAAAAIFIFIAIIAVTAILFGGWLIVSIVRGAISIGSYLLDANGNRHRPMALPGQNTAICPQANCRAPNPARAAFCRRCGRPMPRAQHVTVRRAAMW
jgi:hypothetical protein